MARPLRNEDYMTSMKNAPLFIVNNIVPFQGVPIPFPIESKTHHDILQTAMDKGDSIFVVPLKESNQPVMAPYVADVGVEMKVLRILNLPDGSQSAFLVGQDRFKVDVVSAFDNYTGIGNIKRAKDKLTDKDLNDFRMTMRLVEEVHEQVKEYFSEVANVQMAPPQELLSDKRVYLNFLIIVSPLDYEQRVRMLEEANLLRRAEMLFMALEDVRKQIDFRKEIYSRASKDMEREQREHFLRAQIRTIQNEIGDGEDDDIEKFLNRAINKNWSEKANAHFEKELNKLKRYNPTTPDYAVQYTYLDTLLNLPWDEVSNSHIKLDKLARDLDKDHYGMKNIKERIIEHMAVLQLRGDMRSPILCLYGPPGVGKTSLCKSIADSIGREYARISLGGLHDETQIRGHRRTYIGALPGRIITALGKVGTNNPVFVLDEVDKIGRDHRGDPAEALLEVLDPEQNSRFHDNYLDVDYDLSKVFFIATANNLSSISAPLLDRMELIEISGYLPEEKIEIAKRHLIPKQLVNHGFGRTEVKITDDAILAMIESYTRESGVRRLEKVIARVLRKLAVLKAKGQKFPRKIDRTKVMELLGKPDLIPEVYEGNLPVGVVAGLAWTPVGGEILYFESSLSQGKGTITLTGNLGDVMKESATIALQWVRANAEFLGIDPERFAKTDVHLHVPEGAVPKDGPSAGITMVCSIAGSFTGRKTADGLAMTGEVTLSGKVLPVGGIKEKILAAKRAGIGKIILSEKNRKDIEDIEAAYLEGLQFSYVSTIREVIEEALMPS